MGIRNLFSIQGNSQSLDGGAMFGNVPKPLWSRWLEPDDDNRVMLGTRALLCQEEGRNILFEAGIGAFFAPKFRERYGVVEVEHVLLDSLKRVGLTPDDVDVVVLSHLHFDHAGGLLSAYDVCEQPNLVFKNATYVFSESAWQRSIHPHPRDKASFVPRLSELLANHERIERVEGETSQVLGEGYRFWRSNGHTPGLLCTEIDMPDGPIVFSSDLIPGTPWVHLPITMGYDRAPEELIDEKSKLLKSLVKRNGRLFFTHDLGCSLASVEFVESKYRVSNLVKECVSLTR